MSLLFTFGLKPQLRFGPSRTISKHFKRYLLQEKSEWDALNAKAWDEAKQNNYVKLAIKLTEMVYALYKQATYKQATTRPDMFDLQVLWKEYQNTSEDILCRKKQSGMLGIQRKAWPRTRLSKSMSSLPYS